jgi:hypothetical protein
VNFWGRAGGVGGDWVGAGRADGDYRVLAPLHSLTYITPSLVALAVRKAYPHRLVLVDPQRERSLQWGSQLAAVKELMSGVTIEDVIEEVLENVDTPL